LKLFFKQTRLFTSESICLFLLLVITLIRFTGLETAPPGFYVDEAVGAAQTICIKETGEDLFRNSLPLFSPGLGAGYYTAPFLYGEALWTSVFGNSIGAFRSFVGFVTLCTFIFLSLWLMKRVSRNAALIGALLGSISPWAFQFSRISWDPPLAPFFLVFGLWCFDLKKKWGWIAGALAFALASYAYPSSRIQAVALLFLVPELKLVTKIKALLLFALANIPLLYRSLVDPDFTARAKLMVLWSGYPGNPYHEANLLGLITAFITNFFLHLSPQFLLFSGDANLRHSTQVQGMLSYPEAFLLIAGLFYFVFVSWKNKKILIQPTILFALAGITLGIAPAALTWEGVPHALRAIGAWPFFVILAALMYDRISKMIPHFSKFFLLFCALSGAYYFYDYFTRYPIVSNAWFQTEQNYLGRAYGLLTEGHISCKTLQRGSVHGSF